MKPYPSPKPASSSQISFAKHLRDQAVQGIRGIPGWLAPSEAPSDEQIETMDAVGIGGLIHTLKTQKPFEIERYGNGTVKIIKKAYDPNDPQTQIALRTFPEMVSKFRDNFQSWGGYGWGEVIGQGRLVARWVLLTRNIKGREKAAEQAVKAVSVTRTNNISGWAQKNLKHLEFLVTAISLPEKVLSEESSDIFKIEPFTVHNTVGLTGPKLEALKTLVEVAAKELRSSPFARVLYGDVYVVGNLKRSHTLAWYNVTQDDVYIRPETRYGPGDVGSLIHEFGHRYWYKFLPAADRNNWVRHFSDVRYAPSQVQLPKPGEIFILPIKKGRTPGPPIVTEVTHDFIAINDGRRYSLKVVKEFLRNLQNFPTDYASTSSEEYFAEAFSLYVRGKLAEPFKEHFLRIVNGGPARAEGLEASPSRVAGAWTVASRFMQSKDELVSGKLEVPIHVQEESWSCGSAVMRSILLYMGLTNISEKRLMKLLGTNENDGTDPRSIVKFLRELPGLEVEAGALTIDDLRRAVDSETLVIVDLQAWSDDEDPDYASRWMDGHYVILTGYDDERLYLMDPSSEKPAFMRIEDLPNRWHDEDFMGVRDGRLGISVRIDPYLMQDPAWKKLVLRKINRLEAKNSA